MAAGYNKNEWLSHLLAAAPRSNLRNLLQQHFAYNCRVLRAKQISYTFEERLDDSDADPDYFETDNSGLESVDEGWSQYIITNCTS